MRRLHWMEGGKTYCGIELKSLKYIKRPKTVLTLCKRCKNTIRAELLTKSLPVFGGKGNNMAKIFDTTKPFKCGCTIKEERDEHGLIAIPDNMCPEGARIWVEFNKAWDQLELLSWFEPEGMAVRIHFSAENQI